MNREAKKETLPLSAEQPGPGQTALINTLGNMGLLTEEKAHFHFSPDGEWRGVS